MPAAYYAKVRTAYTAAHKLNAVIAIEVSTSAQCDVVSLSRVIHKIRGNCSRGGTLAAVTGRAKTPVRKFAPEMTVLSLERQSK